MKTEIFDICNEVSDSVMAFLDTINFLRLDHLLITVPLGKLQEARIFYRDILCLTEVPGDHPYHALWFQAGDIQLHIREEEQHNTKSIRHPAFEVSDLSAAKAFLQKKEIALSFSLDITGRDRCFFYDPFGNRFELLTYNKK